MKTALFTCWWLLSTMVTDEYARQPRVEPARLIIYRQKDFGRSGGYSIHVNDKKIGALSPNRYFQLTLSPGRTRIESGKGYYGGSQAIWLTLQPGVTYYVKAVEEIDFMTNTLLIAPVSEEQARRELNKLKLVEPTLPN